MCEIYCKCSLSVNGDIYNVLIGICKTLWLEGYVLFEQIYMVVPFIMDAHLDVSIIKDTLLDETKK